LPSTIKVVGMPNALRGKHLGVAGIAVELVDATSVQALAFSAPRVSMLTATPSMTNGLIAA
jgi:hypothetical protein